ncbi:hypothetical protein AcV7_003147 [Taiwanofungus camphoratus]|nr:hypothetical protein AcV7_003147 [Antrodia cinnamomea]
MPQVRLDTTNNLRKQVCKCPNRVTTALKKSSTIAVSSSQDKLRRRGLNEAINNAIAAVNACSERTELTDDKWDEPSITPFRESANCDGHHFNSRYTMLLGLLNDEGSQSLSPARSERLCSAATAVVART